MPILHNVEQYSEAYDRIKLGLPTSSEFFKILTPTGKPSTQWKAYAYHLIAERLLQRKIDRYTSRPMERGLIVETEAAEWYEMTTEQDVQKIGFITDDAATIGCSPDRLVGDVGLLEIKAPLPPAQVEYLVTGRAHLHYKPQLQGQLMIAEREWVDIVCYHDELPKTVVHVERDEKFMVLLAAELRKFNEFIDGVMTKIGAVSAPPKEELRIMLQRSLEAS